MFNKCIDQHKKPVCFWSHLIGFIVLIYGLWIHSWLLIVVAIILFILGHLFVGEPKEKKKKSDAAIESVKSVSSSESVAESVSEPETESKPEPEPTSTPEPESNPAEHPGEPNESNF